MKEAKQYKKLIVCPTCEDTGRKEVLAEVKDGYISILRFHKGETKITGRELQVICGKCGETAYLKI